jgi:MFS family permease
MHLLICFPASSLGHADGASSNHGGGVTMVGKRQVALLAMAFALAALVTAAISSHASLVMAEKRVPDWLAMAALALIGPMQVAGRIAELSVAHRVSSARTGMIALVALAASLILAQLMGNWYWLALVFAIVYGASNGVMTVVRGTILSELFDSKSYALMLGMLSAPALFARALGPVLTAWVVGVSDMNAAIWMLTLLILLAGTVYWYASHTFRR